MGALTDDSGAIVVDLHQDVVLLVHNAHALHVHSRIVRACLHDLGSHLHSINS